MRALKLVQHMKTNADRMSEAVNERIRRSDRCGELVLKVPAEEQRRSAEGIYCDLTDWLTAEEDSSVKERCIALGMRRAQQGVPFSDLYWAVCIAHEHLWEYIQQECLFDEPVEFWGGVMLLRSLTRFFERALYFALIGYQKAGKGELAGASAA
jgi:hypothetical protein